MNAFAATATGTKKTATVNGFTYSYWSKVETSSLQTTAFGVISSANTVPTGYMGIESRLYSSAGSLISAGEIEYNPAPYAGMTIGSAITTKSGTYYSKAKMQFYNGDGYNGYISNASPNVTRSFAPMPMIPEKAYEVNENGSTYGSDYYAESIEDSPDLIKVLGDNGIEGYVYSKDINVKLDTLSEVLNYINSEDQSNKTIPVYEEDGITVVDTFEITKNEGHIEFLQVSEN